MVSEGCRIGVSCRCLVNPRMLGFFVFDVKGWDERTAHSRITKEHAEQ